MDQLILQRAGLEALTVRLFLGYGYLSVMVRLECDGTRSTVDCQQVFDYVG